MLLTVSTPSGKDGSPWYAKFLEKPKHIVLDTAQYIDQVRFECERYGEISALDFNDPEEVDHFMRELYEQCEHYPYFRGDEYLARAVNQCMDSFQEQFNCSFSSMQRYLWLQVARAIVEQALTFSLYDDNRVCKFTYSQMLGMAVVLKPYDEWETYNAW